MKLYYIYIALLDFTAWYICEGAIQRDGRSNKLSKDSYSRKSPSEKFPHFPSRDVSSLISCDENNVGCNEIHDIRHAQGDRRLHAKNLKSMEVPMEFVSQNSIDDSERLLVKRKLMKAKLIIESFDQKFPVYDEIPATNFSCQDVQFKEGYYADPWSGCQVYHYCHEDRRRDSFLCPKGTIFNVNVTVCDWWYNVECNGSNGVFQASQVSTNEKLPISPKEKEEVKVSDFLERYSRSNVNDQSDSYYYDSDEGDYYDEYYDESPEYHNGESYYDGDYSSDTQVYDADYGYVTTEQYKKGFLDLFATTTPRISTFEALAMAQKKSDQSSKPMPSQDLQIIREQVHEQRRKIFLEKQQRDRVQQNQMEKFTLNQENPRLQGSTDQYQLQRNVLERRQSAHLTSDLNRSTMHALQNNAGNYPQQPQNQASFNSFPSQQTLPHPPIQQQVMKERLYMTTTQRPSLQYQSTLSPQTNSRSHQNIVHSQNNQPQFTPINPGSSFIPQDNSAWNLPLTTPQSLIQSNFQHSSFYQPTPPSYVSRYDDINRVPTVQYINSDTLRRNDQQLPFLGSSDPMGHAGHGSGQVEIEWRPKATSGFRPGHEPTQTENPMLFKINTNHRGEATTLAPRNNVHPTLLVDLASGIYSDQNDFGVDGSFNKHRRVTHEKPTHVHLIGKNCYSFEESGVRLIGDAVTCSHFDLSHHEETQEQQPPRNLDFEPRAKFSARKEKSDVITANPLSLPPLNPVTKRKEKKEGPPKRTRERVPSGKQDRGSQHKDDDSSWDFRRFSLIRNIFGV